MPDAPSDPPRKFYDFKDREFERANPPRPPASDSTAPQERTVDPEKPVDVRELHRIAATPGPVLNPRGKIKRENEVHGILRDNLARENAAGLNHLSPKPPKKSRRRRDYFLLMALNLLVFGSLAVMALRVRNMILFIYSIAALGMITAAGTWVIWFVMDDY